LLALHLLQYRHDKRTKSVSSATSLAVDFNALSFFNGLVLDLATRVLAGVS
jgi:hypothetical protein